MSTVNSTTDTKVNRAVSAQGLAVLRTLAAVVETLEYDYYADGTPAILPAGELTVGELVRCIHRPGASLSVTRASLSRTLRRLWRVGLVELSAYSQTMTALRQAALDDLAQKEADPAAAYQRYKAFVKSIGMPDRHRSVEAYIAAMREDKAHRYPDLRVTTVQITTAGREWVTSTVDTKLTDDNTTQRSTVPASRELTDAC